MPFTESVKVARLSPPCCDAGDDETRITDVAAQAVTATLLINQTRFYISSNGATR